MTLYCPVCGAALDAHATGCANGHAIGRGAGGVIRLMTPEFAAQVDAFEKALAEFRASIGAARLDANDYADLPARPASRGLAPWVRRAQDLDIVRQLAPPGATLRVLDLGAWNGWLSDALARDGHSVTAVSFFGGREDGLGALSRYSGPAWTAIQMDEGRLDLIGETFDRVVVNRCLHAAPDPADRLHAAIGLLRPGGIVIATGLPVYGDPRRRAADFAAEAAAFEARSGMPYRLVPGRDWLGPPDVDALVRLGAEFRPYPGQALRRLKARLRPASPTLQYLVARA
jgi:SAM-dependent methyltransferase